MKRKEIFLSDRIKVTGRMISGLTAARVLEIGAGDYSFREWASQGLTSWIGLDMASPCDIVCDFNSEDLILPLSDRSFDLIVCTEVLEHLLWPQRLLQQAHRVLSDDGHLLLSVPNIVSLSYRLAWLFGRIPSCAASGNLPKSLGSTAYEKEDGDLIGGHVIDFNFQRIVDLLKLSGFRTVRVKGSGIIWHRQLLLHWMIPASFSSNIIVLAKKTATVSSPLCL